MLECIWCLRPYWATLNTPVLVWSPKLSSVRPAQYLDGWPPGNSRCCSLLLFSISRIFSMFYCFHKVLIVTRQDHRYFFHLWKTFRIFFSDIPFLSNDILIFSVSSMCINVNPHEGLALVLLKQHKDYCWNIFGAYDHTTLNTPVLVWSPKGSKRTHL